MCDLCVCVCHSVCDVCARRYVCVRSKKWPDCTRLVTPPAAAASGLGQIGPWSVSTHTHTHIAEHAHRATHQHLPLAYSMLIGFATETSVPCNIAFVWLLKDNNYNCSVVYIMPFCH